MAESTKGTRLLSGDGVAPAAAKKTRRKPHEMASIKDGLAALIKEYRPLTSRQLFYLAVVLHLIRKTQNDYKKVVCKFAVELRQEGAVNWGDIVDETRWVLQVKTGLSLADWVDDAIKQFRKDLWIGQPTRVQVWVESFSAAGLLFDTTNRWRVPLYPCRGYGSHDFYHSAAIDMEQMTIRHGIETHVYLFGDYDPSGEDIIRNTKEKLLQYGPRAAVKFHFIAVTRDQIDEWNLPTAPPKSQDPRSKKFKDTRTVELEAITPDQFRALVESCITRHLDPAELERTLRSEAAQQASARELLDNLGIYDTLDTFG
jgi:hypothetical protein